MIPYSYKVVIQPQGYELFVMEILALSIILLRLTAPFLILRMPLVGVAVCSVLDFYDFTFLGGNSWYQSADKLMDLYYLSFCLYVSLSWKDTLARNMSIWLYSYRLVGVLVLVVTRQEWILFLFPNAFEMFFLFYMIYTKLTKKTQLLRSWRDVALVLVVLTFPKLLQEYSLHFNWPNPEFPLSVVAFINSLPDTAYAIIWIGPPIIAMMYYISRARDQDETEIYLETESTPVYAKLAHGINWSHIKTHHK